MMNKNRTPVDIIFRLRRIAVDLEEYSRKSDLFSAIKEVYGIDVDRKTNPECIQALYGSLQRLKPQVVKMCGIKSLSFDDLGPSKEYYPNHGKYINNTLVLNDQLLKDPNIIIDPDNGAILNKLDQTLYHELGHGWDEVQGEDGDLSLEEDWLKLSGWSKYPKPGLKRIHIKEKNTSELVGEYYYSPFARFTRFYAKRNPWDDWADSFSYYVGGAKSYLPKDKVAYFDKLLKKYIKGGK
jgi:hypothetical protein